MVEEPEKTGEGLQTDEGNTGQETDSQQAGTPSKEKTDTGGKETNWEERYKNLQSEQTRVSQENADLKRRLDAIEQAGSGGGGGEGGEGEDTTFDEEGFVDGKTVRKMIKQAVSDAVSTVRLETAQTYFRKTYPDLVKHEAIIAGIMRSPKDPSKLKGKSYEDRIDAAVKEFQDLTEEAKKEATAKAEAEAKEREEKNRQASGLTSSSTTPPKSGEEELSDEDEIKARKARQAKQRGLA